MDICDDDRSGRHTSKTDVNVARVENLVFGKLTNRAFDRRSNIFESLQFRNNEEVETVIRESLRMQESDFYFVGLF